MATAKGTTKEQGKGGGKDGAKEQGKGGAKNGELLRRAAEYAELFR